MATPESKVRDPVVKWAKQNGVGHHRMAFRPGVKQGVPDDLFLVPCGNAVWVEFKRPGKVPTELQAHRIEKLRNLGFAAVWFDDSKKAITFLDACLTLAIPHLDKEYPALADKVAQARRVFHGRG